MEGGRGAGSGRGEDLFLPPLGHGAGKPPHAGAGAPDSRLQAACHTPSYYLILGRRGRRARGDAVGDRHHCLGVVLKPGGAHSAAHAVRSVCVSVCVAAGEWYKGEWGGRDPDGK